MNRLQSEQLRLYLTDPPEAGHTRAVVLALPGPGAWDALARVWRGVQEDFQLPAPGIAVAGEQGYQLWFSFAQAVPEAQALAFAEALRGRYLADVPPQRIRVRTAPDALPPRELDLGRWAAFVTPDLAAVFADETWLDLPPGAEAQAELLSRLQSMKAADLARLDEPGNAPAQPQQDPRAFLLGVMNDPAVPLPLRIEAAKALLPCKP